MHKVAIIKVDYSYNYDDDYSSSQMIVNSITDWTEVSDEQFKLLRNAERLQGDFRVIEQPYDTGEFIRKTVADYIAAEEKRIAAEATAKRKRDEAAQKKKLAKLARDEASRRQMFEELQKEFGVQETEARK